MMRFSFYILAVIFFLLGNICFGQTSKDSATYWVNQKYVDCIDSGKSVSHCEQQNSFLIMDIDTVSGMLTIKPSIFYSWETFDFNIERVKQNFYSVLPTYGMDSGSVLKIDKNVATLVNAKQVTSFTKIRVKKTEDWTEGDLGRQIGIINCRPFLKYSVAACGDSLKLLLTQEELKKYFSQGLIGISCSDDFHYNEMYIRNCDSEFFVVYEGDTIKIYREPPRDRGEKVDVATLKDCQIFFKSK